MLQGLLQGAGPIGYYRKVLKSVLLKGVLLLDPRF